MVAWCGWWGQAILYVCSKVGCFLVSWLVVRSGRSGADGDAAPTFLTDESGTDATLVAVAEGLRVVGVWRRLVALGCLVWGLAGWGSWPRPA